MKTVNAPHTDACFCGVPEKEERGRQEGDGTEAQTCFLL